MKVQDDHDADLNIGLDMIADRQKLSKAYDEATTRPLGALKRLFFQIKKRILGVV